MPTNKEELKDRVRNELFSDSKEFDVSSNLDNIDFCVFLPRNPDQFNLFERRSLYWAESNKGKADLVASLTQLIATIGKGNMTRKHCPPNWVGAFDCEKIVFMPFTDINRILVRSDINWNLTPSDHKTEDFKYLYDIVKEIYDKENHLFCFETQEKELRDFIKNNLGSNKSEKIEINESNFIYVYHQWTKMVKDTINVDWNKLSGNRQKDGILDADFFLADVLSENNETIMADLPIALKSNQYLIKKGIGPETLLPELNQVVFKDNQKAHKEFWKKYSRPLRKEFQEEIITRRELLVPHDIREIKGAFFTPQKWVELSQSYLTAVLGDTWQNDWYVWDCCAGTGNLLSGLTEKRRVWASTLEQSDIEIMADRIGHGLNLMEGHIFQFDFLNDDFSKLPEGLRNIINNPEKRKKLLIYINPPYAEASNIKAVSKTGQNKSGVATGNKIHERLSETEGVGNAKRELFAQFLFRIYTEIPGCMIGCFSKLKLLQSPSFKHFRKEVFPARLESLFLCPAHTFDNVKGKFPIGFHIWNTAMKEDRTVISADVYDAKANKIGARIIRSCSNSRLITEWMTSFRKEDKTSVGFISCKGNSFQNHNYIYIVNHKNQISRPDGSLINRNNLIPACIYYSVRHAIPATWINDQDQFYWPENTWMSDMEFISDCIMYTVVNLNISATKGVNHWLPFKADIIRNTPDNFRSDFLSDFIDGNLPAAEKEYDQMMLFDEEGDASHGSHGNAQFPKGCTKIEFSKEAEKLRSALIAMYEHYFKMTKDFIDPSYYDIRCFFCRRDEQGNLIAESDDAVFVRLREEINKAKEDVRQKIEEGIYRHGFRIADELVAATEGNFPAKLDPIEDFPNAG